MKTVIVTGSAGNLGQAIVHKFINEGYQVIGTVRYYNNSTKNSSEAPLEEVMIDLLNESETRLFVEKTIAKYGNIDAAILTVGGFAQGSIDSTTTSNISEQYKLNFETAYNIAQPVFAQMKRQNIGRIFLIGSRPGIDAASSKGMVAYGLAKSLLFRLADLMNDEGNKYNVVTSVVVPGTIDTAINREFRPDADFSSWVKPEAIADILFFYCSESAAVLREPVIKVYNNS